LQQIANRNDDSIAVKMLRLLVILSIAALVIAVHEKGSARDNNNEGLRLGNLGETAEAYKCVLLF
jgi:hypothetical protein